MPRAALWQDETDQAIADSIRMLRRNEHAARASGFTEAHKCYIGGRSTVSYLTQHAMEHPKRFLERKAKFYNPNYYRLIVNALRDGLYGDEVKREIVDGSPEQQVLFEEQLRMTNIMRAQSEIGLSLTLFGEGWANTPFRERRKRVDVNPIYPGNIWYECDPDDVRRPIKVIEERSAGVGPDGKPQMRIWCATEEWLEEVDQDGKVLTPRFDHGYGCLPYVQWLADPVIGYEGALSPLSDHPDMQKQLANRISEYQLGLTYQAHSTMWTKGSDKVEMTIGPTSYVDLGEDGEMGYANAESPLDQLRLACSQIVDEMLETGNVPASLIRGGDAQSGIQLLLMFLPYTKKAKSLRAEAKISDEIMCRTLCNVGAAHGLALPQDARFAITFSDAILPSDETAERMADGQDVDAGRMTLEDYLRKHRPDIPAEEVEAYAAKLKAEQATKPRPEATFGFGAGAAL